MFAISLAAPGKTCLMKRKTSISDDDAIVRRHWNDHRFAAEYFKAENEGDPGVLLLALRHLAQAQGIAKVAMAADIERENPYRALSVRGNPSCPR
jgi:DNA-binding phage protein